MDFSLGDRAEAFRSEVRTFLDGHLTADVIERMHATGTFNDKGSTPDWPRLACWPAQYLAMATVTQSSSTSCSTN